MAPTTRSPNNYRCDKCTKGFRSADALFAHTTAKHAHCESCNRLFKSQDSLQQHLDNSPVHIMGQPQTPTHSTAVAKAPSSAHVNPPGRPQQPNLPVHVFAHAQVAQAPPEVVALGDDLARRIATLRRLLELQAQAGQPTLRPPFVNGTTYTSIPAARPAEARPEQRPAFNPPSTILTPTSMALPRAQPAQAATTPPPVPVQSPVAKTRPTTLTPSSMAIPRAQRAQTTTTTTTTPRPPVPAQSPAVKRPSTTIPKAQPPQPTTTTTTTTATAPPPPPPAPKPKPLTHRGITYTTLTPTQQTALHPLLRAHCHTPTRLTLEGYTLTPNPPHTIPPPPHNPHNPRRRAAVVLDCEMAGTSVGDYPISVSLLDFFTGAVLVDELVQPTGAGAGVVVRDWRSAITGITAKRMALALAGTGTGSKDGVPLCGREGARERVLGFVDGETVVVGQSVKYDLGVLGNVCGRMVDSAVVAAEASGLFGGGGGGGGGVEKKIARPAGLVKLCKGLLGMRIRGKGGRAHDSLEDVLATREVVLWWLRNPEALRAWAVKRWEVKDRGPYGWQGKKGDSGRNQKGIQGKKGQSGTTKKSRTRPESSYMCDSDDERLRWEDVVDYDCWPKSPPDWSD